MQPKLVLINLSSLEINNFSSRDHALSVLNEHNKIGSKVALFEYNESKKSYDLLFISII